MAIPAYPHTTTSFLSSHKPVGNRMAFPWLQWAPKRSSSYSGILAGQSCHPVVAGSVLAERISRVCCNKLNGKAMGILQSQKESYLPIPSIHPCKSQRVALCLPLSFCCYARNGEDIPWLDECLQGVLRTPYCVT